MLLTRNTVDIAIGVDHVTRLFEADTLVADLFAGGHELGVEVANLLLSDFIDFGVADAALSLQFLD